MPDNLSDVMAALEARRVIPVVEIDDAASAVPLAETLAEAGLPVLEVTMRTPAAAAAIEAIATRLPYVVLGAGTLLDPGMVSTATNAGARFGVSPGFDPATVSAADVQGLPYIPGAATPSEVMACLRAGARYVKFFPAQAMGGPPAISALTGPFVPLGLRLMPTGGVRADTVDAYLRLPVVFAVGGTWIAPRADIASHRWTAIAQRAKEVPELLETARQVTA